MLLLELSNNLLLCVALRCLLVAIRYLTFKSEVSKSPSRMSSAFCEDAPKSSSSPDIGGAAKFISLHCPRCFRFSDSVRQQLLNFHRARLGLPMDTGFGVFLWVCGSDKVVGDQTSHNINQVLSDDRRMIDKPRDGQ